MVGVFVWVAMAEEAIEVSAAGQFVELSAFGLQVGEEEGPFSRLDGAAVKAQAGAASAFGGEEDWRIRRLLGVCYSPIC